MAPGWKAKEKTGQEKRGTSSFSAYGLQIKITLTTDSSSSFAMITGPLSLQNMQQLIIVYFDKFALCLHVLVTMLFLAKDNTMATV